MARKQKRMYYTFKEAEKAGAYDEYPMLPSGIDPQLHLSRNARPQPFYLICEKDTVIVQMTGSARVDFKAGAVLWEDLKPGDFLYVPGGTPHRIVPQDESVMYRFKAERAGAEGVAWYCNSCGGQLWRDVWDTQHRLSQEGYLQACATFNATAQHRTCEKCGQIHPMLDLDGYNWAAIAAELRAA